MIHKINKIKAHIKFNTVYVCTKCNKGAIGDTVRVEFSGSSTTEMKEAVDNIEQSSHHMPNGWARLVNWEFNCGCAKEG